MTLSFPASATFCTANWHGSRREELSFFDIDNFPCLGSSYQQVRLPAEESRDLQDIHILGSHCSFSCFVNIGYSRNTERVAYPRSIFSAFSSPMPVKESSRERLAFRYDPLNIYGIFSLFVIPTTFSAIRNAISSPSIAQGPATERNCLYSLNH